MRRRTKAAWIVAAMALFAGVFLFSAAGQRWLSSGEIVGTPSEREATLQAISVGKAIVPDMLIVGGVCVAVWAVVFTLRDRHNEGNEGRWQRR